MRIVKNNNLLDLFDTGIFDAIIHQCNCYNNMGAGIAKQIKQRYPESFEADRDCVFIQGEDRLGEYSSVNVMNGTIVNAYGQLNWRKKEGGNTDIEALRSAITSFLNDYVDGSVSIIGLPYGIGAGLGGGNWDDIYYMLQEVETTFVTVEFVLVNLGEKL